MKKLFKNLGVTLIFVIPFLISSCSNDITEKSVVPPLFSANIKVEDGMIVFKDNSSFKDFRTDIDKKSDKELLSISERLGLSSHLSEVQNIEYNYKHPNSAARLTLSHVTQFKERIKDHYLATMLNKDRELQIGKKIYRMDNDYVFVFTKSYKGEIKEFYEQVNSGKITIPDDKQEHNFKNIQVAKVFHENFTLQEAKTTGKSKNAKLSSDNCIQYSPDGSPKRINGSVWTSWWLIYNSGGISTECEEYTSGLFGWFPHWSDYNADRVWVFGQRMTLPLRFAGEMIAFDEECPDSFKENQNDDEVSSIIRWIVPVPTTYLSWRYAEVRCGASIPGNSSSSYMCEFICYNQ
jgi:hypothetical protein